MVKGLAVFRDYFESLSDHYTLIGGMACHLIMENVGLQFRATKDLDIVLCAEVNNTEFAKKLWVFVADGGYEHLEKSTGEKQYYRFSKPKTDNFPFILEIFSRLPDGVVLEGEPTLTPVPLAQDVQSLSAILLDNDYYQCLANGRMIIDGISILKAEFILAFKARAWLDLTSRRQAGEDIDSSNIKKHRNDVFRLFVLLSPAMRVEVSPTIASDIKQFLDAMAVEASLNLKDFGIATIDLKQVSKTISEIYGLTGN